MGKQVRRHFGPVLRRFGGEQGAQQEPVHVPGGGQAVHVKQRGPAAHAKEFPHGHVLALRLPAAQTHLTQFF